MGKVNKSAVLNAVLNAARARKDDEFYTRLGDVAAEAEKYAPETWRGRALYLPADDEKSGVWRYFAANFARLGLRSLSASRLGNRERVELTASGLTRAEDVGTGDFREPAVMEKIRAADIVVTNPPFSLLGAFLTVLEECGRDYLILAPRTVFHHSRAFPLFRSGRLRGGYTETHKFEGPRGEERCAYAQWITTLPACPPGRVPRAVYSGNENKYSMCDGTRILNVDLVREIPGDYDGPMAVPSGYLHRPFPGYEVLENRRGLRVNGRMLFQRVIIRRKKDE